MYEVFYSCYPYKLFLRKQEQIAVENILNTFDITKTTINDVNISKDINTNRRDETQNSMNVNIKHANGETELNVSGS